MSDFEPFYNVDLSYEDNYARGPFGEFAAALRGDVPAGEAASPAKSSFLGIPVDLPFGIPAGPLLNERFTTAAFRMGFDIATYKTVRSRAWGCNPFPNVLAVHPTSADGSLTPGSAELDEGVLADTDYRLPISISNSFGVPSRDPDEWQPDMRRAIAAAGPGQVLLPSFQGSRVEGMSGDDYIADHVATARLVCETGADLMEMNTSCPNEGHNRLLCHDPHLVGRITEAVKGEIGDRPLIVKLAYIPPTEVEGGWGPDRRVIDDAALELMVRQPAARCRRSARSIRFRPGSSTRTAGRRCPARGATAAACAAARFAGQALTWCRVLRRFASGWGLTMRSSAWAVSWRQRITGRTARPAPMR